MTEADKPRVDAGARRAPLWPWTAFVLLAGCFLFWAADRDGFEGDDLNSIVPMFELDDAIAGRLLIYRYAWQPLSYHVGSGLFRLTHSPGAIFLLAPLCALVTLCLLIQSMKRAATRPHSWLLWPALLWQVPEVWFSGLYFNSSILAMPLAALALYIVQGMPRSAGAALAGVLAGVAVLMRLDFLLICPLLVATALEPEWTLGRPLALVAGVACTLLVAAFAGLFDVQQILSIQAGSSAEMSARASQSWGWSLPYRLRVMTMILGPIGWALLLTGGSLLCIKTFRSRPGMTAVYAAATVPALLPLPGLLSVKYMLPLLVFVPQFLVRAIEQIGAVRPRLSARLDGAVILLTSLALAVSIEPAKSFPFVRVAVSDARQIGTHDGTRTFGAYLLQMARVDRLRALDPKQVAAQELLSFLSRPSGPDVLVIGGQNYFDPGSVGWRHARLLAAREGFAASVIEKGVSVIDFGNRRLVLADVPRGSPLSVPLGSTRQTITLDLRESTAFEDADAVLAYVRSALRSHD